MSTQVEEIKSKLQEVAKSRRVKEQMFLYRKERYVSQFPAVHVKIDNGYVHKIVFSYEYRYLHVVDCGFNLCEKNSDGSVRRVKGLWITNDNFLSLELSARRKDKFAKASVPWPYWANLHLITKMTPFIEAYYEDAVRAPTIQLNQVASVFNITFYDFTPYLAYFMKVIIDENDSLRPTTEDSFFGIETKFESPVYVIADMLAHHLILVPERTVVRLKQKPTLKNPNPPDEEKTIELDAGAYFIL